MCVCVCVCVCMLVGGWVGVKFVLLAKPSSYTLPLKKQKFYFFAFIDFHSDNRSCLGQFRLQFVLYASSGTQFAFVILMVQN